MRDAAKLADDYITLWNETDATRRARLLAETWASDATFVDPLMSGAGLQEIEGLIVAVQARFPEFFFQLIGCADGFGDKARFSWAFGPAGEEAVIKGTDFVVREGDRIKSVTGFLDLMPAAA
ncbi:MAG: nuclear transport factor 2 family protein [Alphaproteobacteria bacterium]